MNKETLAFVVPLLIALDALRLEECPPCQPLAQHTLGNPCNITAAIADWRSSAPCDWEFPSNCVPRVVPTCSASIWFVFPCTQPNGTAWSACGTNEDPNRGFDPNGNPYPNIGVNVTPSPPAPDEDGYPFVGAATHGQRPTGSSPSRTAQGRSCAARTSPSLARCAPISRPWVT